MLKISFFLWVLSVSAYKWPSPHYDALEEQLYEERSPDGNGIASLTKDCSPRFGFPIPDTPIAAEWIRTAYHDMATHNIEDGTGGLDASIFFEADRAENTGKAITGTIDDFSPLMSQYTSYADILAMGVIWSVVGCGGPIIPFRGGRIDAKAAGVPGVPEPQHDLASHTESFRKQGLSQAEMITLVACGHTLGGVRSADFPNIVPPNPQNPEDVIFSHFDGTHAFDHSVVSQYLDGSTANPLITIANKTLASDLRIFGSDSNSTMNSLNSAESFKTECAKAMEKMINTVPRGVELTEEIKLLPVKVRYAKLIIQDTGLLFDVSVRFAAPIGSPALDRTVEMFWCDKRGEFKDCADGRVGVATDPKVLSPNLSLLVPAMGMKVKNYQFTIPLHANASVSKFWFEVNDFDGRGFVRHDNGGQGYIFEQDEIVFLPWFSLVLPDGDSEGLDLQLVAGVRSDQRPTSAKLTISDNSKLILSSSSTVDIKEDSSRSVGVEGYSYYSGSLKKDRLTQGIIDSEVVIDGVPYKDGFRVMGDVGPWDRNRLTITPSSRTTLAVPAPGSPDL